MKWIYLLPLVFLLSSCFEVEELQFKGVEGFKMPDLSKGELFVDLSVRIENPNKFKIKVKPSWVNVFVEEKMLGTIYLDQKLVIQKRQEKAYPTRLRVKLEDGAMFSLLKYVTKKEVTVRFKGKVKGSVYGITKKADVDQTRVVNGDKLKLNYFQK